MVKVKRKQEDGVKGRMGQERTRSPAEGFLGPGDSTVLYMECSA